MTYEANREAGRAGQRVIFEKDLATGAERMLVVPLPPGYSEKLYHMVGYSPDSESYLFAVRRPTEILRYFPESSRIETVLRLDRPIKTFDTTPRDDYLSITLESENRTEFVTELVHLPDGQRRRLLTSQTNSHGVWSPDGRELAYTDANCLMVVPWEGGTSQELACASPSRIPQKGEFRARSADYLWSQLNPSWSPDGRKIAWTVPVPETKQVQMWIVDRASGEYHVAWSGKEDYVTMPRVPAWSPDGTRIAFQIWRYPKTEIWAFRNLLSSGDERAAGLRLEDLTID